MKTLVASLLLVLVATSCGKWDGKKDKKHNLTYYCEDFKEKDFEILGVQSSDIDALWVEYYGKQDEVPYSKYSLIVKVNGEFVKENGSCTIDWENDILFEPETSDSYIADWLVDKEKYTVSYDLGDRTDTLTFIYKETEGCKMW
jgi:hypothetical protein